MIIRDLRDEDLEEILRMGRAFAKAAGRIDVDDDSLLMTIEQLRDKGIVKVAENGRICGAAGAVVFPSYWNYSEQIAQEIFWWVDPEARGSSAGLKLLVALENEAKARGANELIMLCLEQLDGEKVAEIYERLGYTPLEKTYSKEL